MIKTGSSLGRACDVFCGIEADADFKPDGFRNKGVDFSLIGDGRALQVLSRVSSVCRLNRGAA